MRQHSTSLPSQLLRDSLDGGTGQLSGKDVAQNSNDRVFVMPEVGRRLVEEVGRRRWRGQQEGGRWEARVRERTLSSSVGKKTRRGGEGLERGW